MKSNISKNLSYIVNYINTSYTYVDLVELMIWCDDNGYMKDFYTHIYLIHALTLQHNDKLKQHDDYFFKDK